MIRESLNHEKHVLWILVKQLMGISKKWAYICSEIWEINLLQKIKLKLSVIGHWDCIMRFQLNLHKLRATLVVASIMFG
jgi:hypothetical protein